MEESKVQVKKPISIIHKIIILLGMIFTILFTIFIFGRYGWKLFGFHVCESAGIEKIEVTEGQVRITGFCPGSFLEGFVGYHAEEKDGKLYVGFKFSKVFGIFENGDFAISIPVEGEIKEVIIKTQNNEYSIWSQQSE